MRFASMNVRQPRQVMGRQRAERGDIPDFQASVNVQGISPPMNNMRDINAANMAFTAMPEMKVSPFNLPEFNEAQFRA